MSRGISAGTSLSSLLGFFFIIGFSLGGPSRGGARTGAPLPVGAGGAGGLGREGGGGGACIIIINIKGKCSKILNTFLFLFSNKMLVIRTKTHKMLVWKANWEYPDQTASSEAV